MYTLADQSQFQATEIMLGKHKLDAPHMNLMNWISQQFGVNALDFFCETRESGKSPQQLVHVILETADDAKKMQANRPGNAQVAEQFSNYFKSAESRNYIQDPLKNQILPASGGQNGPRIIVSFRPLQGLSSDVQKDMLADDRHAILKTFDSFWTMSQSVVFYYTDQQKKENLENGTSARITESLQRVDVKHGWGSTRPYYFDSKESFDRDYEGKWHYYWK